eukprot:11219617-Lingulodinium_polyedra.AAC.1
MPAGAPPRRIASVPGVNRPRGTPGPLMLGVALVCVTPPTSRLGPESDALAAQSPTILAQVVQITHKEGARYSL